MNGTFSPGFCNSQKPAGVAYKGVLNPGGTSFPLPSQNAALADWKGMRGQ
jgi:hypothetical protein